MTIDIFILILIYNKIILVFFVSLNTEIYVLKFISALATLTMQGVWRTHYLSEICFFFFVRISNANTTNCYRTSNVLNRYNKIIFCTSNRIIYSARLISIIKKTRSRFPRPSERRIRFKATYQVQTVHCQCRGLARMTDVFVQWMAGINCDFVFFFFVS